jgi:hypothetical protein
VKLEITLGELLMCLTIVGTALAHHVNVLSRITRIEAKLNIMYATWLKHLEIEESESDFYGK